MALGSRLSVVVISVAHIFDVEGEIRLGWLLCEGAAVPGSLIFFSLQDWLSLGEKELFMCHGLSDSLFLSLFREEIAQEGFRLAVFAWALVVSGAFHYAVHFLTLSIGTLKRMLS